MFRIFKISVTLIGLSIGAVILGGAFFEFLPLVVQNTINETLSKKTLPISLKVRHLGLRGSDFSEIVVGGEKPFARVSSLRVDYSPGGLWQKKISRLSLSGIELNLQIQDGKLILPWQLADDFPKPQTVSDKTREQYFGYLDTLGEISIDSARINLSVADTSFSIPCSATVRMNKVNPRLIIVRAELMLREQQITTTAEIDLDTMEMRTDMAVEALDLIRFADLTQINNEPAASGRLGVTAEAHIALSPLSLISAEVSGKIERADIVVRKLRFANISNPNEEPFFFTLSVDKNKGRFNSNFLALSGPFDAQVGGSDVSFSRSNNGDAVSFDGDFSINIMEQKTADALAIAAIELVTRVHGEAGSNGDWHLRAAAVNKQALAVSAAGINLSAQTTDYALSASGKGGQTTINYNVKLSPLNIDADNFTIQLPEFSARGETLNGKSKFILPFEDFLFTANGEFSAKARGKILLSWPYQTGTEDGEVTVDKLQLADLDLGSLHLALRQEPLGFEVEGRYQSALIDTLCIDLAGHADYISAGPDIEIQFQNGCEKAFKNLDLGRFVNKISGFLADAEFTLGGKLLYKDGKFFGKIDSQGKNIRITAKEKNFTLEGGALDLGFTELPIVKTGPKQKISFRSLKYGKITANNGLVEFQVESPESIFIEKGAVQWSDGHVYTQALRFSPKVKDYDLVFFCDRLNFAELLEQLGAATADGQGRVNGRVPVRITDGKFFLENGFLYSTPGEGGKIKLTETALLTEGIPHNTPQFGQIDLAREALKDFSYDWTKLDINSESAEDLLLHLQISGKPSNPLPFVYSQEFGGFARVEASSPGSRFQGIKLDVNFRLPLNQVLHYGDSIKSLLK